MFIIVKASRVLLYTFKSYWSWSMWGVEESPSRSQAQETIGPQGTNWAKHIYLKEDPWGYVV